MPLWLLDPLVPAKCMLLWAWPECVPLLACIELCWPMPAHAWAFAEPLPWAMAIAEECQPGCDVAAVCVPVEGDPDDVPVEVEPDEVDAVCVEVEPDVLDFLLPDDAVVVVPLPVWPTLPPTCPTPAVAFAQVLPVPLLLLPVDVVDVLPLAAVPVDELLLVPVLKVAVAEALLPPPEADAVATIWPFTSVIETDAFASPPLKPLPDWEDALAEAEEPVWPPIIADALALDVLSLL